MTNVMVFFNQFSVWAVTKKRRAKPVRLRPDEQGGRMGACLFMGQYSGPKSYQFRMLEKGG